MSEHIKSFLSALHSALGEEESYRLEVTRKGANLDMILVPVLKDKEVDVPDEGKQIRAALSMPLVMQGMSLNSLADGLQERMQGYGIARSTANEAYKELLATLQDATASAKNSRSKSGIQEGKTGANKTDRDSGESSSVGETADAAVSEKAPNTTVGCGVLDF